MRKLIPFIALLGALVAAPAAGASTLKVAAGSLSYVDTDPGARNSLTFAASTDGKTMTITESGTTGGARIPVASDGSCMITRTTNRPPRTTATCPLTGVTALDVQVGDQDDTVSLGTVGIGARLAGGAGNDKLTGGSGDDALRGEAGADTLKGGAGHDTADYSDRVNALTISMDDVAGDGEAGENDNVGSDVEVLVGGAGPDVLSGNAADNTIYGNAGDDVLTGREGADTLGGGDGNDTLAGGDGADVLQGNDGIDTTTYAGAAGGVRVTLDGKPGDGAVGENDSVDTENVIGSTGDDVLIGNAGPNALGGGDGNDRILGGAAADALDGGNGDDILQTLDGETDQVVCGEGTDGVVSDKPDVRVDCEYIKYRVLSASSTALHVSKGAVRIPVRCSPATAEGCRGRLALKLGRRTLGTRTFHLVPGRRWVAKITLTRRGRALVTRKGLITASLVARDKDLAGVTNTTRQTIRVAG
jgi:hypothetical protein